MNRAFDDESEALRRGAQAVERAAEKLEKSAEKLGSADRAGRAGGEGDLDRRLTAFEDGLAKTVVGVTAELLGGLRLGFDDLFSGLFGLFSSLATSPLGFFGDLLELILPFAGGGFVGSPTLALLGEGGPEYVLPEASLHRALEGGLAGMAGLLADVRGAAPSATGGDGPVHRTTTVQHFHYAPVIGSLDKLDTYNQRADAGQSGRGL
ncbi:MAG: hypothetical protein A2Y64_09400 [Candidatus Coatesbacteria bacterium RBG_13_66_14]|uniref:Uncharacterized protein n=1 Tax=Candidatus Coatesbacteria bacterium RBG_13_66_14 TaxID=1817816 RepID=A0A1F5FFU8_9BACT|nr:MAG: hypothetical protein A2Y64_09400 [Candidatus Coatesbacteria bacterium RBG_13_66_14]